MIDPSTGYPFENNLSSVTIISSSSIVGDGLSTTTFGPVSYTHLDVYKRQIFNLSHTSS